MSHTSSIVVAGKLITAGFNADGSLSYLCQGKDGNRLWFNGQQQPATALAIRIAAKFLKEIV